MIDKISRLFLKSAIIFNTVAVGCWLILAITAKRLPEQSAVLSATYPGPNYSVSVKATALDSTPYYTQIFARIVDENNMYGFRFSADDARMIKKYNGSWDWLSDEIEAPVNGDTVSLEVSGNQLTVRYNSVIKTTITDDTFGDVGKAGLGIGYMETVNEEGGMNNQELDDFAVTSLGTTLFFDNFSGETNINLESHTPTNGGLWQKLWYADQAIIIVPVSYHISQKNNFGKWQEKYTKHFPVEYSTENFIFDKVEDKVTLRFELKDSDFGDVEKISLNACGKEVNPTYARYVSSRKSVLAEIINDDNWVINNKDRPIEVSWQIPDTCQERVLVSLKAHEYQELKSPMKLPKSGGKASYDFENNKPKIKIDGKINEVDGQVFPLYSEWWKSGTGHPAGYTYVYANDDKDYVYFAIDITGDNTDKKGKDWAEIVVLNNDNITESKFRIDDNNLKYGKCSFGMTSKVNYPHQTCEFKIPKYKLSKDKIFYKLNYYGTMASIDEGIIMINPNTNTITKGENIGNYYSGAIYTASLRDDSTGPIISNINAGTSGTNSLVIGWNTDELSTSQIEYGLSSNLGTITDIYDQDHPVSSHRVHLNNLATNCTTYYFRVVSKDIFENSSNSLIGTFRTQGCPEHTPPYQEPVYNQVPNNSCGEIAPSFSPQIFKTIATNKDVTLNFVPIITNTNGYQIIYGDNHKNLQFFTEYDQGFSPGALLYTIHQLKPNTTYYFQMRARNGCATGPWSNAVKAKTTRWPMMRKIVDVKVEM